MQKYIIGIDTGGTYTDAVLVTTGGEIIKTAKIPTTHHRLSICTGKALTELIDKSKIKPEAIGHIAVSTTLATNAVVENKGARVALFVIGYVKHFKLPITATCFIKGGHTITGAEEEPLDLDNLVDTLQGLKNSVDAYGVCAAMSMENPTHEMVAEKAISIIDPKPVFCSHKISQQTGMRERAATAALHAKLMPLMQDYIAGVQAAMIKNNVQCPMYIIGGNAKTITSEQAIAEAGSTVASGPACTAHFGSLNCKDNSLVIDMGGTTTDIAMLADGKPVMAPEGCRIGDWQTHIEAVEMFTAGIGGDSHVIIKKNGEIKVGPSRVVPIAMSPDLASPEDWLGCENDSKSINLIMESDINDPIVDYLKSNGPATPHNISDKTGLASITVAKTLEQLTRAQLITETGFTPTDALHVLGLLDIGDKDLALSAATKLAKLANMSVETFCQTIIEQTEEKIENLIIDYIINKYWGKSMTGFINTCNNHPILGVDFSVKIPLIGIGAAAKFFLPAVANKLGTTVTFPDHCNVGNAIGAALSLENQ